MAEVIRGADKITIEGDNLVVRTTDGTQVYPLTTPVDPPDPVDPPIDPIDPPPEGNADIEVGPNHEFKTLKAGIEAASDGDTIAVDSGTYTNDFSTIGKNLTIRGVGATRPKLVAAQSPSNGKGILVTNGDITIENLEFSGCKVSDKNGAGIRYEGGNLVVKDCLFKDNQNGMLANADGAGTITITGSEFNHNGAGDGYSHNIYVGQVKHLIMTDCYSHNAVVGHQIKSRAKQTTISGCRVYDDTGNASYSIDLPEGGASTIEDCTIQQGSNSGNSTMISYAAEKQPGAGSFLTVVDNTLVNDRTAGVVAVKNNSGLGAAVTGSKVYGITGSQMLQGPGEVSGTIQLATRPDLP